MSKIGFVRFIFVIFFISACSSMRPIQTTQTKITEAQDTQPRATSTSRYFTTATPEQNDSSTDTYIEKTKYLYIGIFVQSIGDLGRQLKLIESNPSIMYDENFKELVFNNLDDLKFTTKTLKQLPAPSEYEHLSSLFNSLDVEMNKVDEYLRQAINDVDSDKFEQAYYYIGALLSIGEQINSYYR